MVQEFFQICVDEFLKTIGLEIFGIKHFWARFKFVKSRGQIHLHLLGITDDANIINNKLWKLKKKQTTKNNLSSKVDEIKIQLYS
jgi:hypothetical protein